MAGLLQQMIDVNVYGFHFIATAMVEKAGMERTIDSFCGFTDCLDDALFHHFTSFNHFTMQSNPT